LERGFKDKQSPAPKIVCKPFCVLKLFWQTIKILILRILREVLKSGKGIGLSIR
jgi:hypothetical protein